MTDGTKFCPFCFSALHDGHNGCPQESDCGDCGHPVHDDPCGEDGCGCENLTDLS